MQLYNPEKKNRKVLSLLIDTAIGRDCCSEASSHSYYSIIFIALDVTQVCRPQQLHNIQQAPLPGVVLLFGVALREEDTITTGM